MMVVLLVCIIIVSLKDRLMLLELLTCKQLHKLFLQLIQMDKQFFRVQINGLAQPLVATNQSLKYWIGLIVLLKVSSSPSKASKMVVLKIRSNKTFETSLNKSTSLFFRQEVGCLYACDQQFIACLFLLFLEGFPSIPVTLPRYDLPKSSRSPRRNLDFFRSEPTFSGSDCSGKSNQNLFWI
ncbi:hypothetical protein PGT21_029150 [Puccinia graminis f. sp. tritici]|uniref:Uncharacterized protein n=1 Tax=Puccinia graminis f. sp. tritici TaxID=56615 RepID=A0A5B0P5P0_PUCGR|nr:hypothetical protein PGT21_029150 [Puccinia graminis f. sp. tritici]